MFNQSTRITLLMLTFHFIFNLGCAEVTELEDEYVTERVNINKSDTSSALGEVDRVSEENNSRCVQDEIKCEQRCFYDHGQTFGELSPFYNSCMSKCERTLNRCLQEVNIMPPNLTDEITYSWEQPPSKGIGGYYGYCGPTAAANLVTNVCGHRITPMTFADESFGLGPGASPNKLSHALNELGCCGEWSVCQHDPEEVDVFEALQQSLPAAVMLNWSSRSMHWVTVMKVEYSPICRVIYNHWGDQATMGCNEFIERWAMSESSLGRTSLISRLVSPFTYICQVNSEPSRMERCQ